MKIVAIDVLMICVSLMLSIMVKSNSGSNEKKIVNANSCSKNDMNMTVKI